jgi:hypothetical protein
VLAEANTFTCRRSLHVVAPDGWVAVTPAQALMLSPRSFFHPSLDLEVLLRNAGLLPPSVVANDQQRCSPMGF